MQKPDIRVNSMTMYLLDHAYQIREGERIGHAQRKRGTLALNLTGAPHGSHLPRTRTSPEK